MFKETPAAASVSAVPAGGSGPAARPFCRRPTSGPLPQTPIRPSPRRWADPVSDIERELYGALMPDVTFLRQRGFGVHREVDGFRVGNRLVDADGLQAIAARERRLLRKP
ncbi:hypothetical protein [Enhydrobacter aerosaccus]|nr:hypothetical protein [Enhydrobacter aerosaccus]